MMVLLTPLLAGVLLVAALRTLAAHDVRDDVRYIVLYFALGAAWVAAALYALQFLGVSARDDVIERGNRAAAYVIAGAVLAITLSFIGGNIGDGPGWWVVIFSAGLATGALFLTWLVLEMYAAISDAVTIARDEAAGIRVAGFLLACGVIFGRAAAGDWVSAGSTFREFLEVSLPIVGLLPLAVLIELVAQPSASRPAPPIAVFGVLPAMLYLGFAAISLMLLGVPT
jgi:uncharacterized membrane protein YjfL (UPF0719 family)